MSWDSEGNETWGAPDGDAGAAAPETERRYSDGKVIGQGGMGVVRRVTDERLMRDVALKTLRPDQDTAAARRRFATEARLTGRLQHPGIVTVHDLDRDADGQPYYTMGQVRGRSLQSRVLAGDLGTTANRVEIVRRACDAVAYAHDQDVVHRDLKPANIMVGPYGEVVVLDWGLAEEGEGSGRAGGTPGFMAPEQLLGKVDRRSDVYSLGATLLAVLDGLEQPADRAPGRDVPWELAAVIRRAMAAAADERYPDVRALGADLAAWLERREVSAATYGPLARLAKWLRRNRRLATAVGATVAVAGLVIVVLTSLYVRDVTQSRDRALRAEREVAIALAESMVALADARRSIGGQEATLALLAEARAILETHDAPTVAADVGLAVLEANVALPAARSTHPMTFSAEPGEVMVEDGGFVTKVSLRTGEVGAERFAASVSGSGNSLLPVRETDEGMELLDLHGQVQARIDATRPLHVADSGALIVGTDGPRTRLGDVKSGARWTLDWRPIAVSLSSSLALAVPSDVPLHRTLSDTFLVDLRSGEVLAKREGTPLCVSPGLEFGLYATPTGFQAVRLADGEALWHADVGRPSRCRVERRGRNILVRGAAWSGLLSASTGERGRQIAPLMPDGDLVLGPASEWVYLLQQEGTVLWPVVENPGPSWQAHTGGVSALDISPDGILVATVSHEGGRLKIWDWRSRSLVGDVLLTDSGLRDVAFGATGTDVFVADRNGAVQRIDLLTGERHLRQFGHGIAASVASLPEGGVIAGFEDGTLLHLAADLTEVRRFVGDTRTVWQARVHGDHVAVSGRHLDDPLGESWNWRTGEYLGRTMEDGTAYAVGFTADGEPLFGTHRGRLVGLQEEQAVGQAVILSADTRHDGLLAIGAHNGRIAFFFGHERRLVYQTEVAEGPVQSIRFTPDGRAMLIALNTGLVVVWDFDLHAVRERLQIVPGERVRTLEDSLEAHVAYRDWRSAGKTLDELLAGGRRVDALQAARIHWALGERENSRTDLDGSDTPSARVWAAVADRGGLLTP